MSYPKDRLLDERPSHVNVRFEGDNKISTHPDCGVRYYPAATEKDGWLVFIDGPLWTCLIIGEDLEKGEAGMVKLLLTGVTDDDAIIGDIQFAELTWDPVVHLL